MSLKRECDVCGKQEPHNTTKIKEVQLPGVEGPLAIIAAKFDACQDCLRRLHQAATRVQRAQER